MICDDCMSRCSFLQGYLPLSGKVAWPYENVFFGYELLKPCYASLCGKWAGVYNHVHILTFLIDLQWLPVLLLTYKRIHCVAPSYLIDVLKFYDPVMCLRSKSKSLLSTLKYELEGCGGRASCVVPPIICGILYWNT